MLEWGDSRHAVSRQPAAAGAGFSCTDQQGRWAGAGDCVVVDVTPLHPPPRGSSGSSNGGGGVRRRWQFISVSFVPDRAAQDAYAAHTKRPWGGAAAAAATGAAREETALFFEVAEDGSPVISGLPATGPARSFKALPGGFVHSVLPTKLVLPSPVQWQGAWLLSVDRQEVQSVGDNDWNKCMLDQAPRLFAALMAWAAAARPHNLRAVYALLPPMHPVDGHGPAPAAAPAASNSARGGGGAGGKHRDNAPVSAARAPLGTTLLGQKVRIRSLFVPSIYNLYST